MKRGDRVRLRYDTGDLRYPLTPGHYGVVVAELRFDCACGCGELRRTEDADHEADRWWFVEWEGHDTAMSHSEKELEIVF